MYGLMVICGSILWAMAIRGSLFMGSWSLVVAYFGLMVIGGSILLAGGMQYGLMVTYCGLVVAFSSMCLGLLAEHYSYHYLCVEFF